MRLNNILSIATLLGILAILLLLTVPSGFTSDKECCLEVKYVIYDASSFKHIEAVSILWVNGAIEYNCHPFNFRMGQTVTLTAPENLFGAEFAYWQKQPGTQCASGKIVTDETLIITLTEEKTIWWVNYTGDLSSLGEARETEE